jgi:hypothetical protein
VIEQVAQGMIERAWDQQSRKIDDKESRTGVDVFVADHEGCGSLPLKRYRIDRRLPRVLHGIYPAVMPG